MVKKKESALLEIQTMATVALRSYQVWWALSNRALQKYEEALNLYADFFIVTKDSCFRVVFVELARLLDKRSDANSLVKYVERYSVSAELLDEYNDLVKRRATEIKAVLWIRNKAIAHQDKLRKAEEVFIEANLRIDNLKSLLDETTELVRKLIREHPPGGGQITDSMRYENCTIALAKHIHEWQLIEPKGKTKVWIHPPE